MYLKFQNLLGTRTGIIDRGAKTFFLEKKRLFFENNRWGKAFFWKELGGGAKTFFTYDLIRLWEKIGEKTFLGKN